jgi:peptidyl-prolyl cis-trans isomerase SurA
MRNALLVSIIMIASVALNAGETLDRIVATVDRHPITRSDVEQEARFNYLTEGRGGQVTQEDEIAALERLVDRNLIADQVAVFGVVPVTKEDMDARVAEMRKQLPGAETDPGWHRLLSQYGLTDEDISSRVTQEIQMLRFIDLRFRSEVRVGPRAVQTYYDTKFVPEMKKKSMAPPPPLDQVQDQIEAILREERVNALISDWLKTLRTQSRIQTFDPSLPLAGFDKKTPDISDTRTLPLHVTGPTEAVKQ